MTMSLGKVKVEHDYSRTGRLSEDALADEVPYCVVPIAQSKNVHICVLLPQHIARQVGRSITVFHVQYDGFLRGAVSALRHDSPLRLSAERGALPYGGERSFSPLL